MGEFVSLTSVLEPWFDRPKVVEVPGCLSLLLPDGSRQRGGLRFLRQLWDGLSPVRRRLMAAQFDASNDPANKITATTAFEIEGKIQKWEAAATPTARDLGEQERALETLRRQSAEIDAGGIIFATDARAAAGEAGGSPVEPTPTEGWAPDSADRTPPVYKTGGQGRPTSMNLIASELERRRAAGEVRATQAAEAEALAAWRAQAHPKAPKASAKTIGNSLRTELREAVTEARARKEHPK